MPRGRRSTRGPPPTVHNTVVSFGSGQFYTDSPTVEPPRQRSLCGLSSLVDRGFRQLSQGVVRYLLFHQVKAHSLLQHEELQALRLNRISCD